MHSTRAFLWVYLPIARISELDICRIVRVKLNFMNTLINWFLWNNFGIFKTWEKYRIGCGMQIK